MGLSPCCFTSELSGEFNANKFLLQGFGGLREAFAPAHIVIVDTPIRRAGASRSEGGRRSSNSEARYIDFRRTASVDRHKTCGLRHARDALGHELKHSRYRRSTSMD